MSHSLRLGIEVVPPDVGAAVILLGDEPRVPVSHLHALVAARGSHPIIASDHAGLLVPPVLLERRAFAAVAMLTGDVGLRELIRRDPELVAAVPIGPVVDIDTPDDLHGIDGT
jgi:CTP:molybdopterin cytidylyltransferase MocA